MPGGNFDEKLTVDTGGIVLARGPLDDEVAGVNEMCVWVFQRQGPTADDAISNAMGPPDPLAPHTDAMTGMSANPLRLFDLGTATARWEFDLSDRLDNTGVGKPPVDFHEGPATAMAIGVFIEGQDAEARQRVFVWSEQVWLEGQGAPPGATAA